MKCPYCGDQESKVIDSRHSDDLSIRRRRECCRCGHRFTTYESVESQPILVVKRNGSRQNFDKNKIVNSMIRAFDKRRADIVVLEGGHNLVALDLIMQRIAGHIAENPPEDAT